MKKIAIALLSGAMLIAGHAATTMAADQETAAITATLEKYEEALNKADVKGIADLYSADGVQMAPDFPAAVGTDAIKASYSGTFKAVSLKLDFTIDDIKVLGTDYAVLRSHSNGTLKVNGSDQPEGPVAFKELFVLQKQSNGDWKFTNYSFSAVKN